jgi:chemotaxis response regulator CheB
MPRSAVEAGVTDLVLPLGQIAAAVRQAALP